MTLPERLEAIAASLELQAEALWLAAEALNEFVPQPSDISGYDDDCVPEWAAIQVSLACQVWDVEVPEHIREAAEEPEEDE